MARCLEIAKSGLPAAMPNPSVGAVLVCNDVIIGEGYTSAYGGAHGEVNAFASVKNKDLIKEATLYVSLEPCSHFGKTPPCCDLVIANKVKHVVIGMIDPFAQVSGNGIKRIEQAGIPVTVGVLEKECWEVNKRFFTYHQKNRPYIILKWAETSNGYIAPKNKTQQAPVWITNTYTRQWVHKLRSEEQAILVGTQTVLADNPKLNTRDYSGKSPIRVILDQHLKINSSYAVLDNSVKTIIINATKNYQDSNNHWETIDFKLPIAAQILNVLYKHQIQSVIIEGGAKTLQTFIDENLWDEAFITTGKISFDHGVNAAKLNGVIHNQFFIKNDSITQYKNSEPNISSNL